MKNETLMRCDLLKVREPWFVWCRTYHKCLLLREGESNYGLDWVESIIFPMLSSPSCLSRFLPNISFFPSWFYNISYCVPCIRIVFKAYLFYYDVTVKTETFVQIYIRHLINVYIKLSIPCLIHCLSKQYINEIIQIY